MIPFLHSLSPSQVEEAEHLLGFAIGLQDYKQKKEKTEKVKVDQERKGEINRKEDVLTEENFKKEDLLSKEVIKTKDMQNKEISKKKDITQSMVTMQSKESSKVNMQSKETSKDIMQAKETSEMNMHVEEEDMLLKQENLNVTNIKNLVVKIGNINQ